MPGLSEDLITAARQQLTLGRINNDVRTDFILAPHYSSTFAHTGDKLWSRTLSDLRAGTYEPAIPISMEVPKPSKLTRPGSILRPVDRVVYQLLVDAVAPTAESQLDRTRVFSHVILNDDPDYKMFADSGESWRTMQRKLAEHAGNQAHGFAVRADVASYFETLYQHNLINLLAGCGCASGAVNLLEKILAAFTQRDSHSIIQGVYPSDFLGSFYLHGLDADLQIRGIASVRFVDDIYMFVGTYPQALAALQDLVVNLRREGLHLNECKTDILPTDKLIQEETELDGWFASAKEEVEVQLEAADLADWYGFQSIWEDPPSEPSPEDEQHIEVQATLRLYGARSSVDRTKADKIDKFCLPVLARARSDVAVNDAFNGIVAQPHLSNVYAAYLARFLVEDSSIRERFESGIRVSELAYDWQAMWCFGALLNASEASTNMVRSAIELLRDGRRSVGVRAICAIFACKFGAASQAQLVRRHYTDEPSDYVRSAILFGSRYFTASARNTCIASWSKHSFENGLIADAVKVLS